MNGDEMARAIAEWHNWMARHPQWTEKSRAEFNAILDAALQAGRERDEALEDRRRATAAMREACGEVLWALGHPAYIVVHLRQEYRKVELAWKQAASARDVAQARLTQAERERDEAREQTELLAGNKWSDFELALADKEAHELWMGLHGIKSLDGLLQRATVAEGRASALAAALQRLVTDYQDVPDPTDADGQQVFADARAALCSTTPMDQKGLGKDATLPSSGGNPAAGRDR